MYSYPLPEPLLYFLVTFFDSNFMNEVLTLSFFAAKLVQATLLQVPDTLFSELFQKLFRLMFIHKTFLYIQDRSAIS